MAQVVVRVLASADPSLRNVFDNFRSLAKRAGDAVKRDGDTVAKQRVKSEEQITKAAEREQQKRTKTALREEQKRSSEAAKTQAKATKDFEREEQRRTRIVRSEEKARVREQERGQRQTKRDNAQIVRDTMAGYNRITTVAGNAFGNMTKIAKTAAGVVTGFAGAIGVDASFSSIANRGASFETAIVNVANSGSGKGGATPADIAKARKGVEGAADATKTDQNAMAGALGRYTSLTGDIDTGIASLTMFGKLARATGTDVEDLAGAAAQIANGFGDVPDKAAIVEEALRIVAQQGKLGSVEIKDLATHMGKFASKAQFYEGTREDAMATLGAVAQLSMKGGASTAVEAASAAGNFNRDISTDAAKKAFKKYGVERKGKSGRMRDAGDIIIDALKATGGDGEKLQEMFRNQSSRKGVLGAAGIYNAAGGGKAGEDAVRAELSKLRASISKTDVETNFQNSANTRDAKAADLNNKIQRKMGAMIEGLMPAFESMIPSLESMANSLIKAAPAIANFTKFLVDNPAVAITGAIVGSIAKAGIGEAVRGSLKSLLEGMLDRKPKPGGGGAPGAPATPGGGGGAAATAVAAASWGYFFDKAAEVDAGQTRDAAAIAEMGGVNATEAGKGDNQALLRLFGNISDMEGALANANMPGSVVKDKGAWETQLAELKAQRDAAMNKLSPTDQAQMMAAGLTGNRGLVPESDYKPGAKESSTVIAELKGSGEKSAALLQSLLGALTGGLSVTVTNMPAGGFDPAGRVPGAPT